MLMQAHVQVWRDGLADVWMWGKEGRGGESRIKIVPRLYKGKPYLKIVEDSTVLININELWSFDKMKNLLKENYIHIYTCIS